MNKIIAAERGILKISGASKYYEIIITKDGLVTVVPPFADFACFGDGIRLSFEQALLHFKSVTTITDEDKAVCSAAELAAQYDIITGINGIPSQPGEVLDNHTVNMARLDIRKHLLETGAVEVRARRPIVDIGIIDNEIRFVRKEIIQHQLLVFHRTAPLFIILHRKTDIERHMHI